MMTPGETQRVTPSHACIDVASLVVLAAAVVSGVLLALRLRYGADTSDEAYYAALAYRFAVGLRPILDDLSVHQFASYLVSPYVRVWLALAGSTDGMILALRGLYLGMVALAGLVSFRTLRRVTDWRLALLAVLASSALIPLEIPAPSYNTLAIFFVSIAVSLLSEAVIVHRGSGAYILPGACLCVATFCYPTLVALIPVGLLLVWCLSGRRPAVHLAIGCVGAALALAATMLPELAGLGGVASVALSSGSGSPVADIARKALSVLIQGASNLYLAPAAWLASLTILIRLRRKPLPPQVLILLPLSVLLVPHIQHHGLGYERIQVVSILILCAALVTWSSKRWPPQESKALTLGLGIGAAMAALTALTSAVGFISAGYGAMAVAAPAIALLLHEARASLVQRFAPSSALLATVLVGVLMTGGLLVVDFSSSYRDADPLHLTTQAPGPWAGILTTQQRAESLARLDEDIEATTDAHDRIYVYNMTPAPYLMTDAKPVAPLLWMTPADVARDASLEVVLDRLADPDMAPTVVVVGSPDTLRDSGLGEYLESRYRNVLTRQDYTISRSP